MAEIVSYLQDKKISAPSQTLVILRKSRPKSAKASPNNWLTMFQIWSKSVHFLRSYSRTREGRSFGPQSKSIHAKAFGRIINQEG